MAKRKFKRRFKKKRAQHLLIRFFKPTRKKVAVFFALFGAVLVISWLLSTSGTFFYRNCIVGAAGIECFNADLTLIGLPHFFIGDYYIGQTWVPPSFSAEMFLVNLVIYWLIACAWSFAHDEALRRVAIPKIKRVIREIE